MKVLVVSGFLGSGKTTWIKYLTDISSKPFVILENEYADINLDAPLLKSETKDLSIWEMTEGCICCSAGADFATSVLTISNTLDPEYLIVEPTGVALLSNILLSLKRIEYDRISILPPITIVDGVGFLQSSGLCDALLEDQIRQAGVIVVSKNENMNSQDKALLESLLRRINYKAEIVIDHYSEKDGSWWEGLLNMGEAEIDVVQSEVEFQPERLSIKRIELSGAGELAFMLEDMLRGRYGTMIRAKGSIKLGNAAYLRFDLASERYHIDEIAEEELNEAYEFETRGACIFIGWNLKEEALRRDFGPRIGQRLC